MKDKSYSHWFEVSAAPEQVLAAMKNVRAWWGNGIKGNCESAGDSFVYRHKDLHVSTQTVTELTSTRMVWEISESKINFVDDKAEWENTKVIFEIKRSSEKTRVTLTHFGLQPNLECFEACSGGWNHYFAGSLKKLIETGKGEPDPEEFSR